MSIIGTVYEDVTTNVLGEIGSWQWLTTFLCAIHMVPSFFNQHEDTFLLRPSYDVKCLPPDTFSATNVSLCTYNNGTEVMSCKNWHIKLMWMVWFEKSWIVFCDDKMKLFSTAMIFRLGLVFGFVIFGLISDSFGRKIAIIIDIITELVFRIVIVFCNSEAWFRLFIFLGSLLGSASLYMGLIIVCEIASNSWRTWLITFAMLPKLFAMVCSVPLANSTPNAETYVFISWLFGIILVGILRWTPESPQWLLFNRKIESAEKLLCKAAERNGYRFSAQFKIRPLNYRAYNCLDETTTCIGVLTTYNIRVTILVSLLFWSLYYYLWNSLYLRIYSNENVNQLLTEILCCLCGYGCLMVLVSAKLRMRHLLMLNLLLTGAFTASMMFFKQKTIHSLLLSLALASGVIGHALILNITPRLFAINIRAMLFGCCHATGQLGAIISYIVFLFLAMDDIIFAAVEVVVILILAALCFVVPDVDGRELPDVMEDMDYFSELSKPLRWATQKSRSPSKEEMVIKIYSFGSAGHVVSSHTSSNERLPAQRIGFIRLWRLLVNCVRKKISPGTNS